MGVIIRRNNKTYNLTSHRSKGWTKTNYCVKHCIYIYIENNVIVPSCHLFNDFDESFM